MRLRAGDPNNHGYVEPTPEEYAQMSREREARRQREREAYDRFVNSDENREYQERLESNVRFGHYPHPPVAVRPLPAALEAVQRDLLGGADQVSTDAPSEAERSSENSSAGADAAAGPETLLDRENDLQNVSTGSTAVYSESESSPEESACGCQCGTWLDGIQFTDGVMANDPEGNMMCECPLCGKQEDVRGCRIWFSKHQVPLTITNFGCFNGLRVCRKCRGHFMTPEELEEAEEDDRLQDFSIFEGMTAEQVARFGQPTSGCTFTLSQEDYEASEARREREARDAEARLAEGSASAKRKAKAKAIPAVAKPKAVAMPKPKAIEVPPKAPPPMFEDIPGRRCGWCNGLLRDRYPYGVICVDAECFRSPLNPNIPWDPRPFVVQAVAKAPAWLAPAVEAPAAKAPPPPEPKEPPELLRRRPFYRSTEMCQVAGCARRAKHGLLSDEGRYICCRRCPQRRGHDHNCNLAEELRLGWRPIDPPVQAPAVPPEPKAVPQAKPKAPPWHNVLPSPQAPDTQYHE